MPIILVESEPVKMCALNKSEHIWGPNLYILWTGINILFCPVFSKLYPQFFQTNRTEILHKI